MPDTVSMLDRLLRHGEAVMHERPAFAAEERPAVLRMLNAAFVEFRLDVAGPLLSFAPEAAWHAAQFIGQACWSLAAADSQAAEALSLSIDPASADDHLSADLTLRFLATVYRRVRSRPLDDPLHSKIVDALRRWPLSGAASELPDPPTCDLNFHGHAGLQLKYAERLAAHLRPDWIPAEGRTREAIELVLQQQGKRLPPSPGEVQP